jgi:hypothetical protein
MSGMDSKRLSQRARQPGHDRTFRESESNFIEALRTILDLSEFSVDDKPKDLARLLGGHYGIQPEASIEHRPSGRKMYFEVKKQGPGGNADERACKHHTVQFYRRLADFTGYEYHAFCTIMCESLADLERYTVKHAFFFEPEHYFAWKNYDLDLLADYIAMVCDRFLLRGGAGVQTVAD